MKTLNFFALLMTLAYLTTAYAGDYVQDPAPVYFLGNSTNTEPFKKSDDPEVCAIYLKNLQYLARRNHIMSCGQEVAPILKDKIQAVKWINLDPRHYPTIFLHDRYRAPEENSPKAVARAFERAEFGVDLFRVAVIDISGRVIYDDEPSINQETETDASGNSVPPLVKFKIFQYGEGDGNENDAHSLCRCNPTSKNYMSPTFCTAFPGRGNYVQRTLFMVNQEMSRVYGMLVGPANGENSQNLWLIKNRAYAEFADSDGDVTLYEINPDWNVHLDAVCLFHYKKTTK